MRKWIAIALMAVGFAAAASEAYAGCPAGTRYSCTQGFNGKVVCGCH